MTINIKNTYDLIEEIEQKYDVNSLIFRDINLWPLIRIKLVGKLGHLDLTNLSEESKGNSATGLNNVIKVFGGKVLKVLELPYRLYKHGNQLKLLRKNGPKDILFFSRQNYNREKVNNKFYDPFMDPLIELLQGEK